MNQTSENGKKPNSGPNFGLFAQIWAPKFFFDLPLPDVRHCRKYVCIQFHGKLKIQTQENGEKSHFVPDLGLFGPNSRVSPSGGGGAQGYPPTTQKNGLSPPMFPPTTVFTRKCQFCHFHAVFDHFAQIPPPPPPDDPIWETLDSGHQFIFMKLVVVRHCSKLLSYAI